MANGRFYHPAAQNPISAGIESFQRQAGQYFQSQAQVNIYQQERERREQEERRKTVLDVLKTAETIKDPERRVAFLRMAGSVYGVQLPDEAYTELAVNDPLLKSMKRLPDLILEAGRQEAVGEFTRGLPGPTTVLPEGAMPEEVAAQAKAEQEAIAPVARGIGPTPESQLIAGQVGSFIRRGEQIPTDVFKEARRFLQPETRPAEQLTRLREAMPTPEGAKEEITTVLEEGKPKVTRKVTTGEDKPPSSLAQIAWLAAGPEGGTSERAKKALETWKTRVSERQGRATTSTFIEWATSDDKALAKRGEKAIALWKGLNENAVVQARVRAFDRATKAMAADPKWAGVAETDPARKLEFRRLYRRILEEFFLPSGEAAGGADLSSLTDEELAQRALDQDDEAAMEELLRRQGGQ